MTHVFTPESARRTLPRVRPTAELMCRLYAQLSDRAPARIASDQPVDEAYFDLVRELLAALDTLRRHGVVVRDAGAGRLGFPARRQGRSVLLSWRVGEPALAFWCEIDDAESSRRPLREDGLWEVR
ncbi:MAG: DUF2203 family protein [bacterium]|nr:DUF2203 family protein [bacterium]